MEFHKLPSNPNPRPNTSSPFFLEDMEQNQFIHSRTSHFKVIPPRLQKLRNLKKQKTHFKSPSIPFYQSSKFQVPNINSPRPRKPYWPKVYTRRQSPNPNPRNIPKPLPPPQLINLSHTKKFKDMIKNVQPGINIHFSGEVENVIKRARWEGLGSHLGKRYFTHLMGEFYCNMRVVKGLDGVMHFTTCVNKKTILVDHKTINIALHLPACLIDSEHPCIDIYSHFIFDKNEFKLMLSVLCESDVPLGLCDKHCSIHYKHFSPIFQNLALFVRANVLPKPNQSKYFDFFDMKILFLLSINKLDFNISYVILLNLINANFVGYMPYGLLISSIFNICHIHTHLDHSCVADSQITPMHIRPQVPLVLCQPQDVFATDLLRDIREEDIYLNKTESARVMFEEQNLEIRRLRTENEDIKRMLSFIESLAALTMGNNRVRDMEVLSSFQVQTVNNAELINELESVGAGVELLDSNGLPNMVGEFGFVAAMEDAIA